MTLHKTLGLAVAITALAVGVLTLPVRAGGDKVVFPQNHASGVLFATIDRPDNKQFRELYAPQSAVDAAKKGQPMPDGTVITMVTYAAQLGPDGNPTKDANGRFIKTDTIRGIFVMEKRKGWGTEYPDNIRNGEWEYQAFTPDKKVNDKANLNACFTCHKPLDKQDFVFSFEKMKSYAK